MSDEIKVKIACYYSGYFKMEDGELKYLGGEVDNFEVNSRVIFEDVLLKMLDKGVNVIGKMWYKLPFEDLQDRQPLFEDVDSNKKKLTARGRWMGALEIYFEKPEVETSVVCAEVETSGAGAEVETSGVRAEGETSGVCAEEHREEQRNEQREAAKKIDKGKGIIDEDKEEADEQMYYDAEEAEDGSGDEEYEIPRNDNYEEQILDEDEEYEIRRNENVDVFNNDNYEEQILDEDEEFPATDNSSGDEAEQCERQWKSGSADGVFSLRQVFNNKAEFTQCVIRYILKTRRNIVYDRWEKSKVGAKCNSNGCGWRIYCSVEHPIGGKWMVKVYENQHQCHPTGKCELIRTPIIADIFLEDIRRDPEMSGPEIKDEMKRRFNIIISPNQAKIARRRVFNILQAECDEQFARLRDYELQLTESNRLSTVEINTKPKADGGEAFHQMYICFEPLRSAWKENCRPVIGLDGTFLKHNVKGIMLTAIGRDPNNQIFPIAWAIVDAENNSNWEWFIRKVKADLDLGLGDVVTIISDMHKGLIHGVATELPKAEHRACARHIYSNLKKNHKSDMLKPLFWRVASSYNEGDYNENLEQFKQFDPQACAELLQKDQKTWCRAFFRVGSCCADTHNNHTESFNRTLKIARKKPFVQMLELVRRDAMQRIAKRSVIAGKEPARFTPKARKELEKACDDAQYCAMITSTGGDFEIVEFGNGYAVNLTARTCACRKWDLTRIPCRHAVCAIREMNFDVENYVSDYFLTAKWQETYRRGLKPVSGCKFWKNSGRGRISAPPYKRPPGRPKGKARIKGLNESPKKKMTNETRVGREGRVMTCSICGNKGHTKRACPNESEENKAKKRRLHEEVEGQRGTEVEVEDTMGTQADVEDISSTAPPPSQMEMLLFGGRA